MEERYSRQILFAPIGVEGQRQLLNKHVLIIGVGTLGAQSSEMFARAGVGKLTIVDRDYIEWSNLQRQQLYTEADVQARLPKAIAAKRRLQEINSDIEIEAHILDVTPKEMEWLIADVDLIIDATDNFDIRMIMNDISQKYDIPWIFGSCVGSYGMSFTIIPKRTPCLHCLMETIPVGGPTCDTAGIIMPTSSRVVGHQVAEALKLLTHQEDQLLKKLLSFDVWSNYTVEMDVATLKNVECLSCGEDASYPFLKFDDQMRTAVLCGRESVQIRPPKRQKRNLKELGAELEKTGGQIAVNDFLLSFVINEQRMVIFSDGRALIHGTNDIDKAKTLYHRYFA